MSPPRVHTAAAIFVTVVCSLVSTAKNRAPTDMPQDRHPLMPGVRSDEIADPDWPRTLHDKQLTGFSPLVLGMTEAPQIWATIPIGGDVGAVETVQRTNGTSGLLINDGIWRFVNLDGEVEWTSDVDGRLIFFGDLHGSSSDFALFAGGNTLSELDGTTGETSWSHTFSPHYLDVKAHVADALPDLPGMEAVVFPNYGEEGGVISFPPSGDPGFVWWKTVVADGEWPERYDHGCDAKFDLSVPDEPLVWNVRHHRVRGFDARTGEMKSELLYEIGDGHRRNYGPWELGQSADGSTVVVVAAEMVQTHVHGLKLNRNGPSELAWQRYYGEVYVVPGVAVESIAMVDVDGDGGTELVYNARDPENEYRSFVRIRDALTGVKKTELADTWCAAVVQLGESRYLLTYDAPGGAMPKRGNITIHRITGPGQLDSLTTIESAHLFGPPVVGGELILRKIEDGNAMLVRYAAQGGEITQVTATNDAALVESPTRQIVQIDGEDAFLVSRDGRLEARRWNGEEVWSLPVNGGPPSLMSAADINSDGRAEIIATAPGGSAKTFSIDAEGGYEETSEFQFSGGDNRRTPQLYDLLGDGSLCVVAPGTTDDGHLAVRAFRADGSLLWETELDTRTDDGGSVSAWNAGQFLPGPSSGVAISVVTRSRYVEGTFLLDGATGDVQWFKGQHWEGDIVRPFVPSGLMTAFDVDGDGLDEIGMDMLSYMAFLNGEDGGFALLKHSPNIRAEGALYAAQLYNSFVPVYENPEIQQPHWLSPLGFGVFGLMNPDPSDGVWRVDASYDTPQKVGMVDVDGDGKMEVGYCLSGDSTFICRDLFSGKIE